MNLNLLYIKAALIVGILCAMLFGHQHFANKAISEAAKAEHDKVQLAWTAEVNKQRGQALEEAADRAIETQRRDAAHQKAQDENYRLVSRMRADAVGSSDALSSLRHDIANRSTDSCSVPANSSLVGVRQGGSTDGDLLAACAAEYQAMAVDADADRASGIESNGEYDALTLKLSTRLSVPVELGLFGEPAAQQSRHVLASGHVPALELVGSTGNVPGVEKTQKR